MRHIALAVDGILRDPVTGQPEEHGRNLYHALANNYRITLLSNDHHGTSELDWLRVERFERHTSLFLADATYADDPLALRLWQIRQQRATAPLDLVVDCNPHLAEPLYRMGQPYLLYINPKSLARPPARETWQELADRIADTRHKQALALQAEET